MPRTGGIFWSSLLSGHKGFTELLLTYFKDELYIFKLSSLEQPGPYKLPCKLLWSWLKVFWLHCECFRDQEKI